MRRVRRWRGVAAAAMAVALALGGLSSGASSAAALLPATTIATKDEASTVGALFMPGSTTHSCTASVVDSPAGDLVMTAAHCVASDAIGARFVPGYDDGLSPFGTWTVTDVFVDAQWVLDREPDDDVAFLLVTPSPLNASGRSVESVVGANDLSTSPHVGQTVTVSGYGEGSGDQQVTCTVAAYDDDNSPAFDCPGFVSGTSGSPWITGSDPVTHRLTVGGIIGGYEAGGFTDDTSYSPPFDATVFALRDRAIASG